MPDFVLDRSNCFIAELLAPLLVFMDPERFDDRVFQIADYHLAIILVHQKPRYAEQCRSGRVKQSQNRIIKDVFHTRAPGIRPDLRENSHEARGDEMLVFRIIKLNDIEADMEFGIGRIEINYIFYPMIRNQMEYFFHKLAMRINYADAFAVLNILNNKIGEQYRLTCSRLTKNIHVLTPVFALDSEDTIIIAKISPGKVSYIAIFWNFIIHRLPLLYSDLRK